MFGFGKKSFESEMADFDREAKRLGPKLLASMQGMDIMGQIALLDEMNKLNEKRIECCKRHGKPEDAQHWMSIAARGKELRG